MAADKFGLAKLAQQLFRANAEVLVFGDEQPKLIGKIKVGLVVRRGRKQDALAFVCLDVFLNRAVALAFPIAQVVALVDHDQRDSAAGRAIRR